MPNPVDIMITHDWPAGITDYGDVDRLLQFKSWFRDDIEKGQLGNPAGMGLLYVNFALKIEIYFKTIDPPFQTLRPKYWFSAHLHCMFTAEVPHDPPEPNLQPPEPTKFLSLDKPIPHRHFLKVCNFIFVKVNEHQNGLREWKYQYQKMRLCI